MLRIALHTDPERFFQCWKPRKRSCVILALKGVAGLNAAEHLRSLCSDCGLIWCSDLDFSLHAFRLRAQYFLPMPVMERELREGLCSWKATRP